MKWLPSNSSTCTSFLSSCSKQFVCIPLRWYCANDLCFSLSSCPHSQAAPVHWHNLCCQKCLPSLRCFMSNYMIKIPLYLLVKEEETKYWALFQSYLLCCISDHFNSNFQFNLYFNSEIHWGSRNSFTKKTQIWNSGSRGKSKGKALKSFVMTFWLKCLKEYSFSQVLDTLSQNHILVINWLYKCCCQFQRLLTWKILFDILIFPHVVFQLSPGMCMLHLPGYIDGLVLMVCSSVTSSSSLLFTLLYLLHRTPDVFQGIGER